MIRTPSPANANKEALPATARSPRLLEWLSRLTSQGFSFDLLHEAFDVLDKAPATTVKELPQRDDWIAVTNICGYDAQDFASAKAALPLTAAEIDYFRRNHRGIENTVSRDFRTAQTDLPSPLCELYGLYRHRVRTDVEAALVLAQASNTTRVARNMADLLAIGAFANGAEYIGYLGVTYSVPAAFDTAEQIDRANSEALRRLSLPADHPSHMMKMTPDDLGILASSIAESSALSPDEFLRKANLLAESRQDVNRLPINQHFTTAFIEGDLPLECPWTLRLTSAYARILPGWVRDLPEIEAVLN